MLLPWIFVVMLLVRRAPASPATDASAGEVSPYDDFLKPCRPGPWGELRYTRILIEPPREFLSSDYVNPDPLRWTFVGYTAEKLAVLWRDAGLPPDQISALGEPSAIETTPRAIVVKPLPELVRNLTPGARTKIYSALSAFPENPNQAEPFRFRADSAEEWLGGSGLSAATTALVKRMMYRRGTSLLFSDHDVVLPLIPVDERVRLVRTLARKSTLLLRLRLHPESDLNALVAYWGRGPRRKGLYALLQSLSHRSRGIDLDVAHLLPRFARGRLFTYPQASDYPGDGNHDCHWASLNFFNDPPDERFADAAFVKHTLENDYVSVNGPAQLGDIIALSRPDGQIIHSCVYIADDIVFTKNGGSEITPFILMTLPDVIAFYPADPPLRITAFRRKDL